MEDNKNINYGNALFSVAIIDLKTYLEVINTIDKKLEEPNFILDRVLKSKNEEYVYLVKNYAFTEYVNVVKYLKEVKKSIIKYMKRLEKFLNENPNKKEEFDAQLDILIPLFEDKEKFANQQIEKCFKYFKQFNEDVICEENFKIEK